MTKVLKGPIVDDSEEDVSSTAKNWKQRVIGAVKIVLWFVAIYFVVRIIAVPVAYQFFLDYLSVSFGLEDTYARPFAIAASMLVLATFPTLVLSILFGYRAYTVTAVMIIGSAMLALLTHFYTKDVYFDRTTGVAQKCYAKTLEGFKFSSTCDFDPKLGVRFQKITPAVTKEIVFWQKSGGLKNVPDVEHGKYFDPLTGEPIAWYSISTEGRIRIFSLPGFDPMTGELLKPITKEVIARFKLEHNDAGISPVAPANIDGTEISAEIDRIAAREAGLNPEFVDSPNLMEWIAYPFKSDRRAIVDEDLRTVEKRIWTWVRNHRNVGTVASEFSNDPFLVKVEKVLFAKKYVVVVVAFTNMDTSARESVYEWKILDRDAHDVTVVAKLGDFYFLPWPFREDEKIRLRLNPKETKQLLFFVEGVTLEEMRSGYLVVDEHHLRYDVQ